MFEFYKNDPEEARWFAKAMAGLRRMDRHLDYLLHDGFNWSAIMALSLTAEAVTAMFPRVWLE